MKKLLTILAMSGCLIPASANIVLDNLQKGPTHRMIQKATEQNFTRAGATDNEYVFGYCSGINTAYGFQGMVAEAAIEIPEEMAQEWIGNSITGIRVGFGQSNNPNIFVFATYDLEDIVITGKNATITQQLGWNTVKFDEPVEITGETIYIGYQSQCSIFGGDFPIGVDGDTKGYSPYGDWLGMMDQEAEAWEHMGKIIGNVSIQILISGDKNIPQVKAEVSNVGLPSIVTVNEPFEGGFVINNQGQQPIENVEYTFTLNGETVKSGNYTFDQPITSGNLGWIIFDDLVCEETGQELAATATLLSVNGQENENPDGNTYTSYFDCSTIVFEQKVLVEEFTGTWCGNCPRGIVGMAYMRQKYGEENFIGVAVHNGDEMASRTYSEIALGFSQGAYPSAVMNRQTYFDPNQQSLEELYLLNQGAPTFAGIELTDASFDEENFVVDVTGVATFSYDMEDANYLMAIGLCEDHVGPYVQENYFSGSPDAPGNWGSLPAKVSWMFEEVARIIVDPFGIKNSIPSSIVGGQEYSYSTTLKITRGWNLMNAYLVGYILDGETGAIVNSCKLETILNAEAGVEGVKEELKDGYKVYNPQGIKVLETKDASALQNLPKGIYIVNGKKVVL